MAPACGQAANLKLATFAETLLEKAGVTNA